MPRYASESQLLPRTSRYAAPEEFEPEEPEYGWMDRAVSTGLRVVPALGGAAAGTLAGLAGTGGVAAPYLGLAGGAAGGGLGEWLAQKYEQARGLREDTNLGSVAVEAGLGAIPLGKSATLLKAGLKGAGMGAAGAVGHSYAEEGEMPDLQTLALSGVLGGAFGAGGEAIGQRLTRKAPVPDQFPEPVPEVDFAPTPRPTMHGPEPVPPGGMRYRDTDGGIVGERVPFGSRGFARYAREDELIQADVPPSVPRASIVDRDTPVDTLDEYLGGDSRSTRAARGELDSAIAKGRAARTAAKGPFPKLDAFGPAPSTQPELIEPDPGDLPSSESLLDHLIRRDTDQTLTELRRGTQEYADLPPGLPPAKRTLLEDLLQQDERRTLRELYDDNRTTIEEQALARKPRGPEGGSAPPTQLADILSTGEVQPRLPVAGDVRARDVETPEFEAPYSLTPEAAQRTEIEPDLFSTPAAPWLRQRADEAVAAGYPGTVEDAEAEILRRTREPFDAIADDAPDILQRVRRAGGIDIEDSDLGGELRWLGEFRNQERGAAGSLGGTKDILRRKGRGRNVHQLADDLLGKQATGSDLIDMLADATRKGKARRSFRPEDYAEPAGIRPGARWWDDAPPFVDELTPEMVDEPGAAGFISSELASTLGGGLAGGAAGATQGETPQERLQNALLGAAAGAGGGYGLTRLLRGRVPAESIPGATTQGASPSAQILRAAELAKQTPPPVSGKPGQMDTSAGRVRFVDDKTGDTPIITVPRAETPYAPQVKQPKAQREDLGLDHFPEEQRGTLQELIDTYGLDALEEQRRGRMPHARTEALSRELAAHGGKKMKPGTNLPAEGHRHIVNTLASVHQRARELGARISDTGGTDAEQLELGKLISAQEVLFFNYAGLRTEAGRALGQYRLQANVLPTNLRVVRDLLNRGTIRKDLAEMADLLKAAGDDPDGLKTFELFRNKQTRALSDRIGSYFSANILSGLQTQERNFLGGAARTFGRLASKPVIGGLDALESMLTGKPRQVYSAEALHEAKGVIAGFDGAIKDAFDTLRLGFSRNAMMAGWAEVDKLYYPKAEFAGQGKNPLNWVGRGMEAADRFWRSLNQSMELHALTYADARRAAERQGLTGSAYDSFVGRQIAEARANPSKDLQRRVNKTAERAVYQEDNALANQLNALKKHAPALHYVLPFVKTVANIFKQGIEHTPTGFAMARARSGDLRERAVAHGEAAMGTLALVPIAYYAATGRMSGSGPRDPAERARLYEEGWRPHSVKVPLADAVAATLGASRSDDGDYWVSYALAQPFSIPAAIVANGFEAFDEVSRNASEKTREQAASDIVTQTLARVGKSALDQSFLSGLGSFVEAINDPERAAEGFFGRTAQGFVPLSGALRNVARIGDPVVRQPEGILESFQSNLPGLSQNVAPRLTRFGEPVVRHDSSALVVPETSPVQRDAISDELARLGVTLALPTDRMSGVDRQLTRDESLQVRQTRGRTVRALLSAVMGAPGYEHLPDVARGELLQRALEEVKGDVNQLLRAAVQLQRPDLMQRVSEPITAAAQRTYR